MRIKVLSGGRKSIELPLSDAELNFQMKRIGIEETVPVCRLVEASEKDNPLCKFEGQTVNMDEVNFFAKRMDCLTEYERKVLYSYVTDYGVGTMQDLINLTFSMKGLSLITDFSDAEQVGKRLYLDEFIAMPEEEKQQTNFIKFAEKTFKESRVEVLPYGVLWSMALKCRRYITERHSRNTLHPMKSWQQSRYRIRQGTPNICICLPISVP